MIVVALALKIVTIGKIYQLIELLGISIENSETELPIEDF